MSNPFVIRNAERGHDLINSDGSRSSYIAGHPDGFVTRASSFNFNSYQSGRPGFGPIRVFGDEVFHGAGCGYNMHPHHNFVICAFVFEGELTHINAIYLWLLPEQLYMPPTYHRAHFDYRRRRNEIVQLVGDGDGALPCPQDLRVSRLMADKGRSFPYELRTRSHGAYVFVREGSVRCGDTVLERRDSMGISGVDAINIEILDDDSDVMIVETVMIDDAKIRKWESEHADH
jgi:quercetin 2,3-dioxygenase